MGASDLIKALQNTLRGGAVHIWGMSVKFVSRCLREEWSEPVGEELFLP